MSGEWTYRRVFLAAIKERDAEAIRACPVIRGISDHAAIHAFTVWDYLPKGRILTQTLLGHMNEEFAVEQLPYLIGGCVPSRDMEGFGYLVEEYRANLTPRTIIRLFKERDPERTYINEFIAETVKVLAGVVDLNGAKKYEDWPLAHAPTSELVEILVNAGARPNLIVEGKRVLHGQNGRKPEVVKTLIQAGADPNECDGQSKGPLYRFCENPDDFAWFKALLRSGVGKLRPHWSRSMEYLLSRRLMEHLPEGENIRNLALWALIIGSGRPSYYDGFMRHLMILAQMGGEEEKNI